VSSTRLMLVALPPATVHCRTNLRNSNMSASAGPGERGNGPRELYTCLYYTRHARVVTTYNRHVSHL